MVCKRSKGIGLLKVERQLTIEFYERVAREIQIVFYITYLYAVVLLRLFLAYLYISRRNTHWMHDSSLSLCKTVYWPAHLCDYKIQSSSFSWLNTRFCFDFTLIFQLAFVTLRSWRSRLRLRFKNKEIFCAILIIPRICTIS